MDPLFERGDYRTFVVFAPKGDLDHPVFAIPVFQEQRVSDVFAEYEKAYLTPKNRVKFRPNDMDDVFTLGKVFADIKGDGAEFSVSTILPRHMIWKQVVSEWENQWVFDHLVHLGHEIPASTNRRLVGSPHTQEQVRGYAHEAFNRYMLIALSLYTAFIFTRNT